MTADTNDSAESAGELVRDLTEQVSRLFRDELKLAEYEMTRKAKRLGRGPAYSAAVAYARCTASAACWPRPSSHWLWSSRPGQRRWLSAPHCWPRRAWLR